MRGPDIGSPRVLNAALLGRKMRKREKLWKEAEGRSFRWWYLIASIVGGLLVVTGLCGIVMEERLVGAYQLATGLFLLGISMHRHQQLQINALREIVRDASDGL